MDAGRRRVVAAVRGLSLGRLKVVGAVCLLVALGSWAVASPVGASPDEDYHLVSIWCSHGARAGACESPTGESAVVPAALLSASCYAFHPEQSAACQRQAQTDPAMVRTTRGNFIGAYPPVFYWVDGFFVGRHISTSVITMRIVNLVLFLTVFAAVYLLLPAGLRRAQIVGTLLTAVPLGMFLIPSINPSGWAILSAATFLVSVLGYLATDDRRRRLALGALAALTLLIGAGARADAAMYAIVALAAAVIMTARSFTTTSLRRLAYPAVLAVIAGFAFLSTGQSGAANPDLSTADHFSAGRILRIAVDVPSLWIGGMGARVANAPIDWGLGWLDTGMPAVVWVGAGCLYAAVVFYALTGAVRRRALAAGLVGLAALLIPTYLLYITDQYVGDYLQPRYVLPLLTMLAVVATARLDGTAFRLTRGQRWTAVSVLTLANAVALFVNIRRYVTGTSVHSWNLDRNIQWWWNSPITPMAVCVLGIIAFALGITLLTADLTTTEPATSEATSGGDGPGRASSTNAARTATDEAAPVPISATAV